MIPENTKNPASARHRPKNEGTGFNDSLDSYLNQIGRMKAVDPELLNSIAAAIDDVQLKMERQLGLLGFSALEYCRFLGTCFSGESSPEDYFLYSSLRGSRESAAPDLQSFLQKWQQEIAEKYSALESAFKTGCDCTVLRSEMQALLSRYRLNGIVADELFQTAAGYRKLNSGSSAQLEERFLMSGKEINRNLDVLQSIRDELDDLYRKMAEINLRLVISIAVKYRESNVALNDLIQEGNMGLMVAVQRFDFKLGNKFSTYAGWWIKHYILKALAEQSRIVRLPQHMIQAIQNMYKAEQRFIQNEGREPENSELASLLELPTARVSAMRKMAAQCISLQAPVGDDENGTASLDDLIAPAEKSEPWRNYAQKLLYDKLYEMLNTLPERERQIIVFRFGLFGEKPLPLTEISTRLKLSRERVRQLEKHVMSLLRTKEYLKFIDGLSHLDG